ncbi:MAG TPA: phospho-sugar mutase [Candidatus Ventricola intestinavium]|nr:phospho-sugar mutase [Candidatus Ventricola intestinavium]
MTRIHEAMRRAALFAQDERFDGQTRREAAQAMENEQELLARFGSELAFGTGGLRGILGVGTARMNRYVVERATQGLADALRAKGGKSVAIAYDSRLCSAEFAQAAACVLAANGITAHVYNRLMPTPMLSFAVRELRCDAGIVVTASHNPAQYNGYKVYGPDGCQITEQWAASITACIAAVPYGAARTMDSAKARTAGLYRDIPQSMVDAFVEKTWACRVNPDVKAPIRLVYTPLHGAGLEPVRAVLDRMEGVERIEVAQQCVPDGRFPTCPRPNPELREALALGLELARRERADLLLATDPDCDRVGVAVRREDGEYTVLTGNEVGLLLLQYLLRTRREKGAMPKDAVAVKTIVTSDLAFAIARDYGVTVTECLTGFKYIGEIIGRLEAAGEEDRFVFGFEESCGYLAGTHVRDKDGVMACMLVAEMAQAAADAKRTLADELDALYARYGCMENRLLSFDIAGAVPMEQMQAVMARLRAEPAAMLAGSRVIAAKDYAGGLEGLPRSDVLSYATEDGKKAIVRPSGTEPKVKVYLSAHADTRAGARAALDVMEREWNARIMGEENA